MNIIHKISDLLRISSVGLSIGESSVHVVELIKIYKYFLLLRFGSAPVFDKGPREEEVQKATRALFRKLEIQQDEVTIHVDGERVRTISLETPPMPYADLPPWVEEEITKKLPGVLSRLAISFHVAEMDDTGCKIFAAYCQPSVLEEHIKLLEAIDLKPVRISPGYTDLFQGFTFQFEKFLDTRVAFVNLDNKCITCLVTDKGQPQLVQSIDLDSEKSVTDEKKRNDLFLLKINEWISIRQQSESTRLDQLVVTGDVQKDFSKYLKNIHVPAKTGYPLQGIVKESKLSPDFSLAAGLAMKKYYPMLNNMDLIPEDSRNAYQKVREKRQSMAIIISMGMIVLLFLIGLNFIRSGLSSKLTQSEDEVLLLQDQIFAIENVKREINQQDNALMGLKTIVNKRSYYSELLYEIGRITPKRVWLQQFTHDRKKNKETEIQSPKKNTILLRGWAFREDDIASLLSRLNGSSYFKEARLIRTERLSPEKVWKKSKIRRVALITFTIHTRLAISNISKQQTTDGS